MKYILLVFILSVSGEVQQYQMAHKFDSLENCTQQMPQAVVNLKMLVPYDVTDLFLPVCMEEEPESDAQKN
jgi:hypothetical protein|tara:strand:+ start:4590 stop:4802 length:213 start_codon:yes stop_codon:yes gene_type:complete